uniref:Uncharacterized protein n=1 Tax=Lactuca sativa TaxID=4236 RepID=A0A9R1XXW6_LACSA|nr:hypothetical protein LSAT_V11C100012620 [Lactuca sativa]
MACFALHNFIRREGLSDEYFARYDEPNVSFRNNNVAVDDDENEIPTHVKDSGGGGDNDSGGRGGDSGCEIGGGSGSGGIGHSGDMDFQDLHLYSSAKVSFLVNRNPTSEFVLKRGVWQGDLLYSFLFIIGMEGPRVAILEALEKGIWVSNSESSEMAPKLNCGECVVFLTTLVFRLEPRWLESLLGCI